MFGVPNPSPPNKQKKNQKTPQKPKPTNPQNPNQPNQRQQQKTLFILRAAFQSLLGSFNLVRAVL